MSKKYGQKDHIEIEFRIQRHYYQIMRELELPPQKLLITNDAEENTVSMYLSLLARGFRNAVGRIIVAPIPKNGYQELYNGDASHLIIDGNHRSIAYTLIEGNIPAIEVSTQSDIVRCRKMGRSGELARFTHTEGTYRSIVEEGMTRNRAFRENREVDRYLREILEDETIDPGRLPPYIRKAIKARI